MNTACSDRILTIFIVYQHDIYYNTVLPSLGKLMLLNGFFLQHTNNHLPMFYNIVSFEFCFYITYSSTIISFSCLVTRDIFTIIQKYYIYINVRSTFVYI